MNISKAILVKESYLRNPLCNFNKEEREADQLSIEALECVGDNRRFGVPNSMNPLPGETKD